LFHTLPLDGPTNVPVFMQEARAASQFEATPGWLAPADPLQLAAAALHDNALAGVMLPKSRSAIAGIKTRMACFPPFALQSTTPIKAWSRLTAGWLGLALRQDSGSRRLNDASKAIVNPPGPP
jgi:hypothetical protein